MADKENSWGSLKNLLTGDDDRESIAKKLYEDGSLEKTKNATHAPEKRISILRYEHILSPEDTPIPIASNRRISHRNFERHLQFLKEEFTVISLSEAIDKLANDKEIKPGSVVITIDGGFRDSILHAFPSLLNYQLPATICLPTNYIDSNSYLLEDRLLMGLSAFSATNKTLEAFETLTVEELEFFKELSNDLSVTPQILATLPAILSRQPLEKEYEFILELAQHVDIENILPDYRDFLTLNEIKLMESKGMTYASLGASYLESNRLSAESLQQDVLDAFNWFHKNDLAMEKCFILPRGTFSVPAVEILAQMGIHYALSIGSMPPFSEQTLPLKLLSRVPMWDGIADSKEVFACRTLGIEHNGIVF